MRLTLAGSVEYDNNITRAEDNTKDDIVFRLTPGIRLVEDREKFNYSFGYALPYEVGVKHGSINDLNQLFDGTFRYRVSPQTEVFGNDGFFYVRGLFSQEQNLADPTTGDVGDNRDRVLQNDVTLGTKHYFTPRLSGTILVNNQYYDTNQFARANVLSFGGSASSEYQLTPHHALGGGFGYSRQMFQDTFNRPSSDTNYYNLFGSWEWLFDETTEFRIQAGPAVIDSSQEAAPATASQRTIPFQQFQQGGSTFVTVFANDPACPTITDNGVSQTVLFNNALETCPTFTTNNPATVAFVTDEGNNPLADIPYVTPPTSVSSTRVTYFANASLTKRWSPNLASSIGYVRQDNGAAGIDGGAVLDAVTLNNSWRIGERWDFAVRADWTQRKSATNGARIFVIPGTSAAPVPGLPLGFNLASTDMLIQDDSSDSLNTQRWGTAARLAYRLTKNTVTALQYAYNKQKSNGDTVGQDSDFDNHLVTFTVQYNFEPIGMPW